MIVELLISWWFLVATVRLILYRFGSTEGSLKCEDIGMLGTKISPHCNSGCLFLSPADIKSGIVVRVVRLSYLRHQEGEYSGSLRIFRMTITIEEHILSSAVAMEIAIKSQLSFVGHLRNELFSVVDSWVQHLTWILPSSVEVATGKRASVIAIDDSIRV